MKVSPWCAPLLACTLAACADRQLLEPETGLGTVSADATATITGTLVDQGGANVCLSSAMLDSYLQVYSATGGFNLVTQTNVGCPDATFSIEVPLGDDYVFGGWFYAGASAPHPQWYLDKRSFDVTGDLTRDVRILPGRALRGTAAQGQVPVARASLWLTGDDYGGSYRGIFESDASGAWTYAGIEPALMQRNLTLTATCSDVLGGMLLTAPFTLQFPQDGAAINCRYGNTPWDRLTHKSTRLVATMFPGMMGTDQDDVTQGLGWGVQYTPAVGNLSRYAFDTRARDARFVFSVDGQLVTSGRSSWYGLDGALELVPVGAGTVAVVGGGRRIRHELAEATSGLAMRQTSWDGTGGDYVLIQVRLENTTASQMTVHGGLVGDWGLTGGASDDGRVHLNGRLSYAKNHYAERYVGSVLLDAAVTPRTFFRTWGSFEPGEGIDVVEGRLTNTSVDALEFQGFHTTGPIKIVPNGTRLLWFAIVAGDSLAELEANAAAAGADYTARTGRASGL